MLYLHPPRQFKVYNMTVGNSHNFLLKISRFSPKVSFNTNFGGVALKYEIEI